MPSGATGHKTITVKNMMSRGVRGRLTSIPITITDLKLCCCSNAWTSGVTMENRDFSTVPRCKGPKLARSTSGTVLPNAMEAVVSPSVQCEPRVYCARTSRVLLRYYDWYAHNLRQKYDESQSHFRIVSLAFAIWIILFTVLTTASNWCTAGPV